MIFHLFFITLLSITNAFANPNIVVSIKPIHSIVSQLTQGITTPSLLLETQQSAHHFHLKPSQLSLIESADLIVSVHPNMEAGLNKALSNLPQYKKIYIVKHDEHINSSQNYHVWLAINNMQEFAKKLTKKLITIDAENKPTYLLNLDKLNNKLNALQKDIQQKLSAYNGKLIASFSNVFDYFIKSNHLQKSTTITQSHGDRLSIQKILKAKKTIQAKKIKCLLSGIEIPTKRINVLTEGLDINTASIDIMGYQLDKGTTHYFDLMQNIANKVGQCLQ